VATAIAACIITYRRPRGLEKLLEHLGRQTGSATGDLLVVVVDNDPELSARPVVEAARRAGLAIVDGDEPTAGIPRARNRSVEIALASGARRLCFIDDDEFPAEGWLARLVAHAETSGVPVVTGPVLSILPPDVPRWFERCRLFSPRRYATGARRDRAFTNNTLVDRRVFDAMDRWFDESMALTGGTDTEFFRRAHAAGFAIEWCDEAVVYEDVPRERCSLRWIGRRHLRQGLGSARFSRRFDGGALAVARILAIGSWRVARGLLLSLLSLLTLGLVPWLRLRLVEDLSSGVGLLLGNLGVTVHEYRRVEAGGPPPP
jgi:GT2 family glycosyltransferase